MSAKSHLYVLWTNDNLVTAEKMVFMYTINGHYHLVLVINLEPMKFYFLTLTTYDSVSLCESSLVKSRL